MGKGKSIISVLLLFMLVVSCKNKQDDPKQVSLLKKVYLDKKENCYRIIKRLKYSVEEAGNKESDLKRYSSVKFMYDSTIASIENNKYQKAESLIENYCSSMTSGFEYNDVSHFDSIYTSEKDTTSLMCLKISIIDNLEKVLNYQSSMFVSIFCGFTPKAQTTYTHKKYKIGDTLTLCILPTTLKEDIVCVESFKFTPFKNGDVLKEISVQNFGYVTHIRYEVLKKGTYAFRGGICYISYDKKMKMNFYAEEAVEI